MSAIINFILNIPHEFLFALLYFLIISLVAIIITFADKRKAEKGKWRIRESTLLIVSALGGSVFMLLTMFLIRHKTKTAKFMVGIPLIMLVQAALIVSYFYFF